MTTALYLQVYLQTDQTNRLFKTAVSQTSLKDASITHQGKIPCGTGGDNRGDIGIPCSYAPCMVYLPTKLGDFVRVHLGVHIPAPWFAYGLALTLDEVMFGSSG